jgi:hypothetical protein
MLIRGTKLWTIIFLFLSLTALILLSAGITDLDFKEGKRFSIRRDVETGVAGIQLPTIGEGYFNILFALVVVSLLLLPIAIIFLFTSKDRKRIIRILFPLIWIAIIYLLIRPDVPPFVQPESALPKTPIHDESLLTDVETISAPLILMEGEFTYTPPQWLITMMTIGLAILIATLLVSVFLHIQQHTHRRRSPLHQLAQEAQEAIDALKAGADLRNTVIRCYYEMNRVLIEQRGVKRDEAMTPREFEQDLEDAGLPNEQVRMLTRLFERVRYGTKVSDEEEERQAIESLSLIIKAIKSLP